MEPYLDYTQKQLSRDTIERRRTRYNAHLKDGPRELCERMMRENYTKPQTTNIIETNERTNEIKDSELLINSNHNSANLR